MLMFIQHCYPNDDFLVDCVGDCVSNFAFAHVCLAFYIFDLLCVGPYLSAVGPESLVLNCA
jgi:hypothetical protein